MKPPLFWQHDRLTAKLLTPVGWLYNLIVQTRFKLVKSYKAGVPVICVGNLTVGGTGKTPVCIALAELLSKGINNLFFLTRGYKGRLRNVEVTTTVHDASAVGDEAVLLSRFAPTVVNPDRVSGAKFAVQHGAQLIIMDDGFQNPYLYKDFSLVVIDGSQGVGNRKLFPAGMLRESVKQGLKRADAVILIGEDQHNLTTVLKAYQLPVIKAEIILNKTALNSLMVSRVIAFAGIGMPAKFFNSLKAAQIEVIETISFADHHQYREQELLTLVAKAKKLGVALVTTEKDYVKIPNIFKPDIIPIAAKIKWEDEQQVIELLAKALKV